MKQTINKNIVKLKLEPKACWVYFTIKDKAWPSENGSCIWLHQDETQPAKRSSRTSVLVMMSSRLAKLEKALHATTPQAPHDSTARGRQI